MNTSDITNYIQKMEQLIQMQQIELDKTRNLLGRILTAKGGDIYVDEVEYSVPDKMNYNIMVGVIRAFILPPPMKSDYERITELKKELNL